MTSWLDSASIGICHFSLLLPSPKARRELTALLKKSTAPQRAIQRARIVLDTADGFSNT
jgi:hypothetical protein